jgi:hypothetical protein
MVYGQQSRGGSIRAGIPVSDDDAPQGESLEESTREANSNLQRLIDAIGVVLAASGDLLARLQQILAGTHPAASDTDGSEEPGAPPPPHRCDHC